MGSLLVIDHMLQVTITPVNNAVVLPSFKQRQLHRGLICSHDSPVGDEGVCLLHAHTHTHTHTYGEREREREERKSEKERESERERERERAREKRREKREREKERKREREKQRKRERERERKREREKERDKTLTPLTMVYSGPASGCCDSVMPGYRPPLSSNPVHM